MYYKSTMQENNLAMLQDTLDIFEKGAYRIEGKSISLKLSYAQIEEAQVFLPQDVQDLCKAKDFDHSFSLDQCSYGCENIDSFSMARKRTHLISCHQNREGCRPVLVLNLANPVNPGGGVRKGSKAQEEDLCRKSSLLISLESAGARAYYEYNRSLNTYMGSDAVMIHPQVEIIKDENGKLLPESVIVAVMTCAAPMLTYGMEGLTQEQYEKMMYNRISGMLKAAAYLGYEHLILGAFGCGAFHNDARVVSDIFYRVLKEFDYDGMKEKDVFRSIDFAVLSRSSEMYNYREFNRNFADFYREEDQKATEQAAESSRESDVNTETIANCTPERNSAGGQTKVFFWKDDEENGCFSNWFRRGFVIDDFEYLFVEQYMMAQKARFFHDSQRYTAILRASTPGECKDLGRQVTPFDSKAWGAVKYDIVKTANKAKYEQNPDLKDKLLRTGNAILAEASPHDRIWGIGIAADKAAKVNPSDWPGQNLLGKILMELRSEFQADRG